MNGDIILSLILCLCGGLCIGLGIYALNKKSPMHFFANGPEVKVEEISDIKAYNKANAIMWISYGMVFIIAGITEILFEGHISIIITVLACFPGFIILIFVYLIIRKKYEVKN